MHICRSARGSARSCRCRSLPHCQQPVWQNYSATGCMLRSEMVPLGNSRNMLDCPARQSIHVYSTPVTMVRLFDAGCVSKRGSEAATWKLSNSAGKAIATKITSSVRLSRTTFLLPEEPRRRLCNIYQVDSDSRSGRPQHSSSLLYTLDHIFDNSRWWQSSRSLVIENLNSSLRYGQSEKTTRQFWMQKKSKENVKIAQPTDLSIRALHVSPRKRIQFALSK